MIFLFLLLLALLGFWVGWRAQVCRKWSYGEDLWVTRMFLPTLSLLVWLGLFVFALGRGWL